MHSALADKAKVLQANSNHSNNFKKIRELTDIKLHFDDLDTFDTFHHLCKADVLCLGTSSFSFLAGFYNKNTVMYLPYYHPPALKSWLVYNH